MPNKRNIKKLIKVLRSGKYKQGISTLREGNCFCILGLACQVSGLGHWEIVNSQGLTEYVVGNFRNSSSLPTPVQKYYGFPSPDPKLFDGESFSHLNDIKDYTFKMFANKLEDYYDCK